MKNGIKNLVLLSGFMLLLGGCAPIYMEDGNWIFSLLPPSIYSAYDFDNAYVIGLDYRVHEPWMHHALYVSHYPPYYYRSSNMNIGAGSKGIGNTAINENKHIRGINENDMKPYNRRQVSDLTKTLPEQREVSRGENENRNSDYQPKIEQPRRSQPVVYTDRPLDNR
ncbi:MAG: hypothetical protein NTV01_00470 [Bacteroidia bacterium]|nr:hypothetical protein [Bacteroidia bacterium]